MFSRLQHFKPIESLTATDLRGLDPEDVKFLVNAQMMGNEQQRLMFGAALNHLQGQQQRMDQAKTNVEKARAAQELEAAKAQMRLIQDQLNDKRAQLLEEAKQGNRIALEKLEHVNRMEREMIDKKIPNAKHPEELEKLKAEAAKLRQEAIQLEQGKGTTGMTPAQELQRMKYVDDLREAIADETVPVATKQHYARQMNELNPDSAVYYHYQPEVDNWGRKNDIDEELLEIRIPPHPQTGQQITYGQLKQIAMAEGISVYDVLAMLSMQYEEMMKKGLSGK